MERLRGRFASWFLGGSQGGGAVFVTAPSAAFWIVRLGLPERGGAMRHRRRLIRVVDGISRTLWRAVLDANETSRLPQVHPPGS